MVLLDYFSGSHGFFLEYVVNAFLFKGPRVEKIFTDLGTSHGIFKDREYQKNKKIFAIHHTEFDHRLPGVPDKIVRISVNSFKGIACYQINVNARAGDVPAHQKNLSINDSSRPRQLRNDLYAKFLDPSLGYHLPGKWKPSPVPIFDFKMESLYDIGEFYTQLRDLSVFLGSSFYLDEDLAKIWLTFMEKNHGVRAWNKCNAALYDIFADTDRSMDLDTQEQALLNALITRCIGLEHGALFEHDEYPVTTGQVRQHLGLGAKS